MKKNIVSPFIQLIWDIIDNPNSDHIISWSPNGTSFLIIKQEQFVSDILTHHFKHGNLSSFIRQLNMYNFHKNKNNTKQLEFFHKLFRRDAKQLLIGIKRKPSQADHRQGQQMLREFLSLKTLQKKSVKILNLDQNFEQDKGSQNTGIQSFYKKQSQSIDMLKNFTNFSIAQAFLPRIVLNIILINKPEEKQCY